MTGELIVQQTGPLSTIQDLGRAGHAAQGVPRSGAADRASLQLANRLLGNAPGDAAIEATLGGLAVQLTAARWCVVTGADAPVLLDGTPVGNHAPFLVPAGATVRLGRPAHGLRSYLAVRGGLDTPVVLGSRSEDVLSGIAPRPLAPGVHVLLGALPGSTLAPVDIAPVRAWSEHPVLQLDRGPRHDWITPDSWRALTSSAYEVSSESNRIGLRLTGRRLARAIEIELPSEGLVPGAMQVPPSGEPVVFLADHPTTGGYPVVAVVAPGSLNLLGQLTPGQSVRFRLRDA